MPDRPIVRIRRTAPSYEDRVERDTARLLDDLGFRVRNRRVLIKPNLVTAAPAYSGITTHVSLCRAVMDRLEDCEVTIANDTRAGLERNGYVELARERGARVVAFDELPMRDIVFAEVPDPVVFPRIPVGRPALETDFVVSIGKLKIHSLAQVTLTLKNLFGLVPTRRHRVRIHPSIQEALADILSVVSPDFGLVDGVIGNTRFEVASHPISHGLLLGGWDPLAVDAVGARCMGFDPAEIVHLRRIAGRAGRDLADVEIRGPDPGEVALSYRRGSPLLRTVQSASAAITRPLARRAFRERGRSG